VPFGHLLQFFSARFLKARVARTRETGHEDRQVIRFFDSSLRLYPASSPAVVGWSTSDTQSLRFQVLTQIADMNECSILDVGCGVGDLFGFVKAHFNQVEYVGVDLHPSMIAHAVRKYPEGTFLHQSLDQVTERADYVLVSGAFNIRVADNEHYLQRVIRQSFSHAKKGVAFNLLSRYAPYDLVCPGLYYYDPGTVFSYCKKLANRVTLRHDYLSNDFSIYLYRD